MKLYTLLALMAVSLFIFLGCEDDNPSAEPPSMELLEAPTALPSNADVFHTYSVRVTGAVPDSILCEVTRPDGTPIESFALYDDGSWRTFDAPAYASVTSHDVVAGNETYTRQINGLLLADSINGTYSFRFVAQGQPNMPGPVTLSVAVAEVSPCVITSYPQDSVFAQCFDPITLEIRVSASGDDEVVDVTGYLMTEYMRLIWTVESFEFSHEHGDLWTYTLTPTLFKYVDDWVSDWGNDDFWFEYVATTRFGMWCNQTVWHLQYSNHTPVLSSSTLPDTAYRPVSPDDSTLIMVTVDMDDCELEGATDFYGLQFDVRREDLSNWDHATNFFLRNDGIEPDAVAGDDTYSSWLVITHHTELLNNLYYFRFYAVDESIAQRDTSDYLLDSIRIIQPGAVALGNDLNPSELGIGAYQLPR